MAEPAAMQARITGLEIENFRAIRSHLKLDFSDPSGRPLDRIVLAGTNGSGKTSILEAILLALGREELIVRDLPADRRGDHWRVEIPPGAKITLACRSTPPLFGLPGEEFFLAKPGDPRAGSVES